MAKTNISGKWRITEMDLCDREAIEEEIVAGSGPSEKPSFLERAKARWGARPPGDGWEAASRAEGNPPEASGTERKAHG